MEALISLPQGQRTSENVSTEQGSILNTIQCVEYTNIQVASKLPLLTSCFTDLLGGFPREMEGWVNATLMDLLNQGEKSGLQIKDMPETSYLLLTDMKCYFTLTPS